MVEFVKKESTIVAENFQIFTEERYPFMTVLLGMSSWDSFNVNILLFLIIQLNDN